MPAAAAIHNRYTHTPACTLRVCVCVVVEVVIFSPRSNSVCSYFNLQHTGCQSVQTIHFKVTYTCSRHLFPSYLQFAHTHIHTHRAKCEHYNE